MKCPYCGEEMIRGYLMSSRDITFAVDNLTKVFRIKKSDDLELSKGSEGIPHCEAYRCNSCKKILIESQTVLHAGTSHGNRRGYPGNR